MAENKSEREIRLEKLEELKKLGINPYPNVTPEHEVIEEVRRKKEDAKAATVGRISAIRGHGASTFIDLVDEDHKLQVYFKQDEVGEKEYNLLKLFDVGQSLPGIGDWQ